VNEVVVVGIEVHAVVNGRRGGSGGSGGCLR